MKVCGNDCTDGSVTVEDDLEWFDELLCPVVCTEWFGYDVEGDSIGEVSGRIYNGILFEYFGLRTFIERFAPCENWIWNV